MSTKEIVATLYDGKRALITDKDHPHYNEIAECKGSQMTGIGWGMLFERIDSEERFFVFKGDKIKWID